MMRTKVLALVVVAAASAVCVPATAMTHPLHVGVVVSLQAPYGDSGEGPGGDGGGKGGGSGG